MNLSFLERKKALIALIEEFGTTEDQFRIAAQEAMRRGMYSLHTNLSDIECVMRRTWVKRKRRHL